MRIKYSLGKYKPTIYLSNLFTVLEKNMVLSLFQNAISPARCGFECHRATRIRTKNLNETNIRHLLVYYLRSFLAMLDL